MAPGLCTEPLRVTDSNETHGEEFKSHIELVRSLSNSTSDHLRPTARYNSLIKGFLDDKDHKGQYTMLRDVEDHRLGLFDKPLPCFGCGIGWFSFLLGFVCPLTWFYATILYFGNCYRKDPRERAGLAASAIAAMVFSTVTVIIVATIIFYTY
ncbi:hypothetical protein QJS10_CPA06g01002 [Acorus calamus]|uniref:Ribosomal protein L18ae family n=1 Tax=Acorus calamus TaxID=4465 RepID=A0AAV9EKU3_ACOCL|nr:hypothetical protein QJS10_CPA06g01002 [Acorus calamus]